ncbi:hypothetical protein M758_UG102900 [Ceratodon purpureus]|nr:hypothetical protein M758_UG102900 [Ceratodon purpureus]
MGLMLLWSSSTSLDVLLVKRNCVPCFPPCADRSLFLDTKCVASSFSVPPFNIPCLHVDRIVCNAPLRLCTIVVATLCNFRTAVVHSGSRAHSLRPQSNTFGFSELIWDTICP